jgi:hypothetical protein
MRHIIFQHHEVLQAVKLYRNRTGKPIPHGSIRTCLAEEASRTNEVQFSISVMPDRIKVKGEPNPIQPMELWVITEGAALAASLLLYLQNRGIPMAVKAEKKLALMSKKICLIATLNMITTDMPDADPERPDQNLA